MSNKASKILFLKAFFLFLIGVCIAYTWYVLKLSAQRQTFQAEISAKDESISEQRDILDQIIDRTITMDSLECDCLDEKAHLLLGSFALPKDDSSTDEKIKQFLFRTFGSTETTVFRGNFDQAYPEAELLITISSNPGGYGHFLILFSQNLQGEWFGQWQDIPWSQKIFQADLIQAKNGLPAFLSLRYGGYSMHNGSSDLSIYTIASNKLNNVFERNLEEWETGYLDQDPTFARFNVSFSDIDKDGTDELIWEGSEYLCKKESTPLYDCEEKDRLSETNYKEVYRWEYDHFVVESISKK